MHKGRGGLIIHCPKKSPAVGGPLSRKTFWRLFGGIKPVRYAIFVENISWGLVYG